MPTERNLVSDISRPRREHITGRLFVCTESTFFLSTRQASAQPNGHVARRISYILGCNAPLVWLTHRRFMEPALMLNPTPDRFIGQNGRHAGSFARHVPFALGFAARQLGSFLAGHGARLNA